MNLRPAESTLPVKKRASSVLEVYKRKKLELDATKKTACEIDAKFSIERLREEQKNRRDLLKKELQTHTQKEEPCVIQARCLNKPKFYKQFVIYKYNEYFITREGND